MKTFFLVALLVAAVQAQQTTPPSATAQPSSKTDELLKNLSPEQRAELLKRLQASVPQAQQPPGETVAPPPQATAEPKTPSPTPSKAKAPATCEGSKTLSTAARVGGLGWYKARVWFAQKTGVDAVGMATDAAKTPCKPAAPAKDQQAAK